MNWLHSNLSLVADLVGFLTLVSKTIYDLWVNPARFKRDIAGADLAKQLKAAESKRARTDRSNWIAFGLLAISYFLMLLKDLQ